MAKSEVPVSERNLKPVGRWFERRRFSYTSHIPERRSQRDRRTGMDRRSGLERRSGIDRRSGVILGNRGELFGKDARVLLGRRSGVDRRSGMERRLCVAIA